MTKSKSNYHGVARWSIRSAGHVTRSDRYDWQFHDREDDGIQYYPRGDDGIQCYLRGDDSIQCYPRGDDSIQCYLKGDNRRQWSIIVWLSSLESQFVIKGAVVYLNWDFSSVVIK